MQLYVHNYENGFSPTSWTALESPDLRNNLYCQLG